MTTYKAHKKPEVLYIRESYSSIQTVIITRLTSLQTKIHCLLSFKAIAKGQKRSIIYNGVVVFLVAINQLDTSDLEITRMRSTFKRSRTVDFTCIYNIAMNDFY